MCSWMSTASSQWTKKQRQVEVLIVKCSKFRQTRVFSFWGFNVIGSLLKFQKHRHLEQRRERREESAILKKNPLRFQVFHEASTLRKDHQVPSYQRIRFHGAGRSLLARPLLEGLTRAAGADAGGRQVEQLGLVFLRWRPRQGAPHPLHRVLPHRLLAVDLKCCDIPER